jgi:hypothetical protein
MRQGEQSGEHRKMASRRYPEVFKNFAIAASFMHLALFQTQYELSGWS